MKNPFSLSLLGVTILAGCSSIEHPVPNGPRYAIIRVMSDNWCADCGEIDRRIAEWLADREKKEELKYPDA